MGVTIDPDRVTCICDAEGCGATIYLPLSAQKKEQLPNPWGIASPPQRKLVRYLTCSDKHRELCFKNHEKQISGLLRGDKCRVLFTYQACLGMPSTVLVCGIYIGNNKAVGYWPLGLGLDMGEADFYPDDLFIAYLERMKKSTSEVFHEWINGFKQFPDSEVALKFSDDALGTAQVLPDSPRARLRVLLGEAKVWYDQLCEKDDSKEIEARGWHESHKLHQAKLNKIFPSVKKAFPLWKYGSVWELGLLVSLLGVLGGQSESVSKVKFTRKAAHILRQSSDELVRQLRMTYDQMIELPRIVHLCDLFLNRIERERR